MSQPCNQGCIYAIPGSACKPWHTVLCKNILTAGGKNVGVRIHHRVLGAGAGAYPAFHGPACPALAPPVPLCCQLWDWLLREPRQGSSGVWHPKLQHSSAHGSLPHWGLAAHPLQAAHSSVLQLGPPQYFNWKKSPTSKDWCFPCKYTLAVISSIHTHCVQRWRFCYIWYIKSNFYPDAVSLEATLTKGDWTLRHYCLPLWQLLTEVWT